MLTRIVFLLLCFIPLNIWAIHDPKTTGAQALGMGNIGVVGTHFNAVFNNQAALAYFTNIAAGINYDQGFFTDKSLSTKSGAFILPTGSGTFGVHLSYFGHQNYNEQKVAIAYGKALGKRLAIGVELDYFRSFIGGDYGSADAVSFEIALYSKLSESLELGAHIINPIGAKIGHQNPENIPIAFQFGLLYHIDHQLRLATEVEKILDQKANYKFGLEYQIVEQFVFRAGVATQPTLFTFGFGLKLKDFYFDMGTGFHQTLGFTPQVSLLYIIK